MPELKFIFMKTKVMMAFEDNGERILYSDILNFQLG